MLGGDGVEEVRHSTAVQLAQAVRDRRIGAEEARLFSAALTIEKYCDPIVYPAW